MNFIRILFLFFLIVPFIEIYVLLEVSSVIGTLPTVVMVVSTAILGAKLLRDQGFATWTSFQTSLHQGVMPAYEIIEGPIILVGGALLLTPGFFTDLLGFACLVPSLRRKIAQYVIDNFLIKSESAPFFKDHSTANEDVIEGEYKKNK
jgi:UPF0716 protein FxsA